MNNSSRRGGRGRFGRDAKPIEPPIVAGRTPPHNLDAEAAVLSAIMLDDSAIDKVLDVLKPEYFWSDANRLIYGAALTLLASQSKIDLVTVAGQLRNDETLAHAGGPSYLGQISDATPTTHNIREHAQLIVDAWTKRQMIAVGQRIAAEGYGDTGPIREWLESCEKAVFDVVHGKRASNLKHVATIIKGLIQKISDAADRGERITGTPTGFNKYDEKTSGLMDGDLTIVAARPGMGKSAYIMNMAVNVASPRTVQEANAKTGKPEERYIPGLGVVAFMLEMPDEQVVTRAICSEGHIDLGRFRNGFLQPNDWTKTSEAATYLSSLPLWIDDTSAIGLLEIRAKVRRVQAEYNREATETTPARRVGLVIVDYLQLMDGSGDAASREQEIGQISRGLKQLAKELKIPIVALSQLNRSVETRSTKDKRPQLSDLRESGAIEQDADNVVFIFRDDYYNEHSDMKGIAELIIAKQRNGSTGKVYVSFNGSYTRFDNLAPSEYPQERE